MKAMTEREFLAQKGLADPASGWCLDKLRSGELRDKTIIEKTLTRAQGHPDNESVQAARRICEKRGYDWRTGEKIPAFKTEGLKTDKLKTVTVEIKDLDL